MEAQQVIDEEKDLSPFIRAREYRKFLKVWKETYTQSTTDNIEVLIKKVKGTESLGFNKNLVTVLFSHKQFKPIYLSKNIENISGYSLEEIEQWGPMNIFRTIHWLHISSFLNMHLQGNRFIKKVPESFKKINPKNFLCGIKLKCKSGEVKSFFLNITRLAFDNQYQPYISLAFIEDVTPLLKGDFYWLRFVRGNNNEYTKLFRSKIGSKQLFKDLISPREMEILKLISAKKDSRAISEILQISRKTVEQHRKNMIARSGARDSTALVQLCRMAEIL